MNLIFVTSVLLPIFMGNPAQAQNTCKSSGASSPSISCVAIVDLLKAKGFSCQGQICKGTLPSYPEPVIVMIPNNYSGNGKVNYHFHGHTNPGKQSEDVHFANGDKQVDYLKFANDANLDSLMVFPISRGKCQTFDSHIQNFKSLEKLNSDLEGTLGIPLKKWSLSFHSGADRTANRLLADPEIDSRLIGVGMFDSMYGERGGIKAALKRWETKPNGPVFQSFYVENGESPQRNNNWLRANTKYGEFLPAKSAWHMGIMMDGRMTSFFKAVKNK